MTEDSELLRRYVEERSESAFTELVQRQAGLVYSAALRQVGGDRGLAEDVSQTVFFDLARKARALLGRPVLASWLYTSTRFAALKALRARARRERREQEAYTMEACERDHPHPDWDDIRPLLDAALCELSEPDRAAILLRYFEGQPFAAMGARLGIGENSARMRSERALDKLRVRLARRGITSTAGALGLALANQAVAAPPAGVAAGLAGNALAHAGAAGSGASWLVKLLKITVMKKISSTSTAAIAVLATGLAFHEVDEKVKYGAFFIYTICFGVGLLFAVLSAILGHLFGSHAEFGHDLGAHGHAEAGSGNHDMPGFAPIGPTTLATFITAFGGLGMIFSRLELTYHYSGPLAAVGATAIAAAVGWFFSLIFRRTQSSSEGHVAALVGHSATVITPIPPDGVGEIAYVQGGSRYSAPARAESGALVSGGASVRIVRIVGSQFYVSPL